MSDDDQDMASVGQKRFDRLLAVLEQQQQARNTPDTSTSGASLRVSNNPTVTTGASGTTYPSVIPAVRDEFSLTVKSLPNNLSPCPKNSACQDLRTISSGSRPCRSSSGPSRSLTSSTTHKRLQSASVTLRKPPSC